MVNYILIITYTRNATRTHITHTVNSYDITRRSEREWPTSARGTSSILPRDRPTSARSVPSVP